MSRPNEDHMQVGQQATMDVTGSLRKISKELLSLEREDPELELRLEGASWLLSYIADCLDIELQHAAARGRALAMKQLEGPPGPNGVKEFKVISGEDI